MPDMSMLVAGCVRFAPSPSGRMHIGNLMSALLAWAEARQTGRPFLLRIEDLDERCKSPRAIQLIYDDLAWLGLDWDGEPYVQSQHLERYEDAYRKLSGKLHVYPCFCSRADLHAASAPHLSDGTPVYPGTCRDLADDQVEQLSEKRSPAYRVEVPNEVIAFDDLHLGHIEQNLATECGDFVLRRSDGVFAYQLVCVVDDHEMGVGTVVRGDDLVGSTPRQIFLARALGYGIPRYLHHPLLLAPDGRRLSKREKDCDAGYVRSRLSGPEPLIGFFAQLLGVVPMWEERPALSAEDFLSVFSWDAVPKHDIEISSEMLPFER